MFFLQALVLINLYYVLGEPYTRNPYPSQTTVYVELKAANKFLLCWCTRGVCNLNANKTDAFCRLFKQRFARISNDPGAYSPICEFENTHCRHSGGCPATHVLRITYDAYHLYTSGYSVGLRTAEVITRDIFSRTGDVGDLANPLFDNLVNITKVQHGKIGFPVKFEGVTTLDANTYKPYHVCESDTCRKNMDDFCMQFADEMKKKNENLMKCYLGCYIQMIYNVENTIKISWAMMFDHEKVANTMGITSREALETMMRNAATGITNKLLRSHEMTSITTLDICQVEAKSLTTKAFSDELEDPLTTSYTEFSTELRDKMWEQLDFGAQAQESCMDNTLNVRFSNVDGKAQVAMDLWLSQTCWTEENEVNGCDQIFDNIKRFWTQGDKVSHNPVTPTYTFNLTASATPFHPKE